MSRSLEFLWLDGKRPSVVVPITSQSLLAIKAIEQLGILADEIVGGLNVPNWCEPEEVRGEVV